VYRFEFTEEEINLIIHLLVKQPYVDVYQLVAKIHEQAKPKSTEEKE